MNDFEARKIISDYSGKPQDLAVHLTTICMCRAGLVYAVFSNLDNYSQVDVGIRFVQMVNYSSLYVLASSGDGNALCKLLKTILLGYQANPSGFSSGLPKLSSEIQTLTNAIADSSANLNPSQPRQLSQCEMDFYVNYNSTNDVMWNLSKGVWNKNGPRVVFNDQICWDLPIKGTGYVTYNVDDLKGKRNDKYGYDQIGTKETIEAMIRIAALWIAYPNHTLDLEYGDVSRPGGVNTPDHGTHMTGKAFDMRLLRKVKGIGGFDYFNKTAYSPDLTKEFILFVANLYPGTEFYFNDPAIEKQDPATEKLVHRSGGHDNHLHVMFPGGKE